ncbi:MAG: helix-turn-helix domain-containing protein [Thermovenabulum sp.]|uniref:helix-turn-helix domain-containing protein n=1 Tax=Thermovenabulum sp. TaxID=3100335 RepID=UPI003C7E4C84
MGRKSKFSTDEKLKYVLMCIEGKDSINHVATLIGINPKSLRQWICNYQSLGIEGISTTSKNSYYSAELKEMAVKDYLAGTSSQLDICVKYGIRSKKMLHEWVLKYNR